MKARRLPWLALALVAVCLTATSTFAAEHPRLQSTGPAVVEMRTAALILSGQDGGSLPFAISVLPHRSSEQWLLMTEIQGAGLRSAEGPRVLELFVYVLGAELAVLDQVSSTFEVDPEAHGEILGKTGIKIFLPIRRLDGARQLRVLVRSGEDFGVRGLELNEVTSQDAPADASRRLLGPIFHDLDGPWLVHSGDGSALPQPFGLAAQDPIPTSRPLLTSGQAISGHLFGEARDGGELVAWIRRPGQDATTVPVEGVKRGEAPDGGAAWAFDFVPPEGLEPGVWELSFALRSQDQELARSGFVPVFVESAVSMPAAEPAPRQRRLSKAQKKLLDSVASTTRRAFEQLAAGDRTAAMTTLAGVEIEALKILDAEALRVLVEAESGVLAGLADPQWGLVLPVMLLYLDLSFEYRRSNQAILAHHATQMVLALAESYVERLATEAAALEAANVVACLGGGLQRGGALSQSEKMFAQAASLGEAPAALLGLASILEKRGRFEQAIPWFERFVDARPQHLEGRLRLALNRARAGRQDQARRALERLTRGDGWIALLAHQELARIDIERRRSRKARAVLQRGLERWPDHPTLTLQLAWVLDSEGDLDAVRRLLEGHSQRAMLSSRQATLGERSRYNRWPEALLRDTRRELGELSRSRLEELGRWLADQPED